MNNFGGKWTQEKINIFLDYVPAYLKIMHSQIEKGNNWRLLYFDGFAGSGAIIQGCTEGEFLEGVATRVLSINSPRGFDMYYFVESNKSYAEQLKKVVSEKFSDIRSRIHVVSEDFNKKIQDMSIYLHEPKNQNVKTLAFIDPYGMDVEWASLEMLAGLSVDMWILVPTGLGINRLLKRDGNISDEWINKLQKFLGLSQEDIRSHFYKEVITPTLFGNEISIQKEKTAVEKAAHLYRERLQTIFPHVSEPYAMKNSQNSTMYHFLLASRNRTAHKIANNIIDKLLNR